MASNTNERTRGGQYAGRNMNIDNQSAGRDMNIHFQRAECDMTIGSQFAERDMNIGDPPARFRPDVGFDKVFEAMNYVKEIGVVVAFLKGAGGWILRMIIKASGFVPVDVTDRGQIS